MALQLDPTHTYISLRSLYETLSPRSAGTRLWVWCDKRLTAFTQGEDYHAADFNDRPDYLAKPHVVRDMLLSELAGGRGRPTGDGLYQERTLAELYALFPDIVPPEPEPEPEPVPTWTREELLRDALAACRINAPGRRARLTDEIQNKLDALERHERLTAA